MIFTYVTDNPDSGVILYEKATGKEIGRYPFQATTGSLKSVEIQDKQITEYTYAFYIGKDIMPDPNGRCFPLCHTYGTEQKRSEMRAGVINDNFNWENDTAPGTSYSDSIVYCMHVRGFTKHSSSKLKCGGTFLGIEKKIPYLKEIGITAIELQPAYEFLENELPDTTKHAITTTTSRLNYWGYKEGFYYAPKASYAYSDNAVKEYKHLVKALHKSGIEVIMQFYFPAEMNRFRIFDILHFWSSEYHVDGFHLMGVNIPTELIAADYYLTDKKIWIDHIENSIFDTDDTVMNPNMAVYNDIYYYDMRKFLKGDDNQLGCALNHMREIPKHYGRIHYMSNYYGFTLNDLVSYDFKHNEANGEDNRDGNNNNCSWNCGVEGSTKSRKIIQFRKKQIKNAYLLLLLSASTPLIFMGDEFGNSQAGNNNPWCLDDETTWLNWNDKNRNKDLLQCWKELVAFRTANPILHPAQALKCMDTLACGYPDLSYHGENAWRPMLDGNYRYAGVLLSSRYAEQYKEESFLYIAINMHWEKHQLALPKLPKNFKWNMAADQSTVATQAEEVKEYSTQSIEVAPRSIEILLAKEQPEEKTIKNKGKRKN